jgi:formylglycine-generating enzyme required for sulfatase activity
MACLSLKPVSFWLAALACLLAAPVRAGITYEMVMVGDPGNGTDTSGRPNTAGRGRVDYNYQIGKYDVTIGQYTTFLNAADPNGANPNGIYNSSMGTDPIIAGISYDALASNGSKYSVVGPYGNAYGQTGANRPITYVSWFDAARFANWMANGQGSGSTENGAYDLTTAPAGTAPAKNLINPNTGAAPTFYVPTENEWYKAAYYSPTLNSGSGGYYVYATQSDSDPSNIMGSGTNRANYYDGRYALTQDGSYYGGQNYLTDVGAFSGSASFYGTFDQSGNVYRWNDLDGSTGTSRGVRGGYWYDYASSMSSSNRSSGDPSSETNFIGFRLASPAGVPEIDPNGLSAVLGLIFGGLGLLERRRYGC